MVSRTETKVEIRAKAQQEHPCHEEVGRDDDEGNKRIPMGSEIYKLKNEHQRTNLDKSVYDRKPLGFGKGFGIKQLNQFRERVDDLSYT